MLSRETMLKSAAAIACLTILLSSGCAIQAGSETITIRENKLGTAIVPMVDVTLMASRKQDDGTVRVVKVTIKKHTNIRVGCEWIDRDDQILTEEAVKFQAMVPDAKGELILSEYLLDAKVGMKIGTTEWKPTPPKDAPK